MELTTQGTIVVSPEMEALGAEKLTTSIRWGTPDPDKGRIARNVIYAALEAASPQILSQALGAPEGATLVPLWNADGGLNLQALDVDQISERVQALHAAMLPGQSTADQQRELAVCQAILRALQSRWVH